MRPSGEQSSSGPTSSSSSPEQAFAAFAAVCRACSDGVTHDGGTQDGAGAASGRNVAGASSNHPGSYSTAPPTYPGSYSAPTPTYPNGGRMVLPIALAMAASIPSRELLLHQADEAATRLGLMRRAVGGRQRGSDGAAAAGLDQTIPMAAPPGAPPPIAAAAASPLDQTRISPHPSLPPPTSGEMTAGGISEAAATREEAAGPVGSSFPAAGSSVVTAVTAVTAEPRSDPKVPPLITTAATAATEPPSDDPVHLAPSYQCLSEPTCCAVCLVAGASELLGLRHGRSVHRCVCYPCARLLLLGGGGGSTRGGTARSGGGGASSTVTSSTAAGSSTAGSSTAAGLRCPLCRQPVEEILAVF